MNFETTLGDRIEPMLELLDQVGAKDERPTSTHIYDELQKGKGYKIVCRVFGNRIVVLYSFSNERIFLELKRSTDFTEARNRLLNDAFQHFPFKLQDCCFIEFDNGTFIHPKPIEFGGPYVG